MPVCSVPGCSMRTFQKTPHQRKLEDEGERFSFHRLPRDSILRNLWTKAVDGWSPAANAVVCSAHFKPEDFEEALSERKLKEVSIPSIFKNLKGKRQTSFSNLFLSSSAKKLKPGPSLEASLPPASSSSDVGSTKSSGSSKLIKFRTTVSKVSSCLKKIIHPSFSSSKDTSATRSSSFLQEDASTLSCSEASMNDESSIIGSSILDESVETPSNVFISSSIPELPMCTSDCSLNVSETSNVSNLDSSASFSKKSLKKKLFSVIRIKSRAPTSPPCLTAEEDSLVSKLDNEELSKKEQKRRKKAEAKRKRQEEKLRRQNEKKLTENTPRKQRLRRRLLSKSRIVKTLRQAVRRRSRQIGTMKNIVKHLESQRLMSSDDLEILKGIGGVHKEFLERQISALTNAPLKKQYEEELRTFALTLHFKSVAAYKYVREVFNLALPHPNTIYRWYKCIDGSPGFTTESFKAIKDKLAESTEPVYTGLIIDEMSIRKLIETDGTRYYGFVDMGSGVDVDSAAEAKEALVIMLTCVNGNWKLPIGYFLTNGSTTGDQKANLVLTALRLLSETKAVTVALTSDGLGSNKTMFKKLGCELDDLDSLKTWFPDPVTGAKIFVFLDSSHMIKLVRNTLGDKQIFDADGNEIKWSFIKSLHQLQVEEGLHLGNKLTAKHILFFRNKMKVALATQVLSKSVADALQVLLDLELEDFKGVEATIKFLRLFDRLFDIFNSRSMNQLEFKQPLNPVNIEEVKSVLLECEIYIKGLRSDREGSPITSTNRQTGFIGFLIDISSLLNLYEILCVDNSLPYLPAHRFCQDHLEMFFGFIRMRGGWNNNPTARQFISAYKKCLIHLELKANKTGNCVPLENISILTCSSRQPERVINLTSGHAEAEERDDLDDFEAYLSATWDETDHSYSFNPSELSVFQEIILTYIAGFVVKRLSETLKCINCIAALIDTPTRRNCQLINMKNRGGLIVPSEDVVKVVRVCEKVIRLAFSPSNSRVLLPNQTPEKLTMQAMQLLAIQYNKLFVCLDNHSRNQDPMFDHKYFLVRSIALRFISLRVHHICKGVVFNANSVRQIFNKLTLFGGF